MGVLVGNAGVFGLIFKVIQLSHLKNEIIKKKWVSAASNLNIFRLPSNIAFVTETTNMEIFLNYNERRKNHKISKIDLV